MMSFNIYLTALASALLHSVWQLALLGLLAALSLAALRRASAASRHTVGMGWLLAMAAAPVLTFWQGLSAQALALQGSRTAGWLPGLVVAAASPGSGHGAADWLLLALSLLWLLAVLLKLTLQLAGWRWIDRLAAQPFQALPAHWQQRVDALQAAMGLSRKVVVRVVDEVAAPFTARLWRPVIWLPRSLLNSLPAQQLLALLAHELAHVRRLDWLWNGLQCVVEALLCHHPAVWWLGRRIRQERELACDDGAVAVCGDAIVMAEALASLGRLPRQPLFTPRMGLLAEGGHLMSRISHLLGAVPAQQPWRVAGGLALLAASGSLLATQVLPPTAWLLNLRTEQSAPGLLTPGQFQDIQARYLGGHQRHYRVAMDDQGQVNEQYLEDGRTQTLTPELRSWVKAMQAFSGNDFLPQPPALPVLPMAPSLPRLPTVANIALPLAPTLTPDIPAPPPFTDSADYQTLVASLAGDVRVTAVTGAPAQALPTTLRGQLRTADLGAWPLALLEPWLGSRANILMTFSGPRGQAQVSYAGQTNGGAWRTARLQVTPLTDVTTP